MRLDINPITGKLDLVGGTADAAIEDAAYYSSDVPTTEAHGGIKAGTTFDRVPVAEVIDRILHKPQPPTVELTAKLAFGWHETGRGLTGNIISATVTPGTAKIVKVEWLRGGKLAQTVDDMPDGGVARFTDDTDKSVTHKVRVTDGEGLTAEASGTYSFVRPMYYGVVDDVPDGVAGLSKVVPTARSGNYTANYAAYDRKRFVLATQNYLIHNRCLYYYSRSPSPFFITQLLFSEIVFKVIRVLKIHIEIVFVRYFLTESVVHHLFFTFDFRLKVHY